MAESADYIMRGTLTEQERLLAQAASYAPEARWLLDHLGVQPGQRVADIGCGPIGVLDVLAERVGPRGAVVGVEREARFVEMARRVLAERQLTGVEVIQADASATRLPGESFDFVHERLVLLQQPDPAPMVAEMVRLVRPGGLVACADIDSVTMVCEPPHPAWTRLRDAFFTVCREYGMDVYFGRRLPGLLRAAGLADVGAETHVRLVHPGEYGRTSLLSLVTGVREQIIDRGLLSEAELAAEMDALQEHLRDPETLVVRELLFQAWGRKPV